MRASYMCPHCKKISHCMCDGCKPLAKQEDINAESTEDGEGLICGHCLKTFSYDESLSAYYDTTKRLPKDNS